MTADKNTDRLLILGNDGPESLITAKISVEYADSKPGSIPGFPTKTLPVWYKPYWYVLIDMKGNLYIMIYNQLLKVLSCKTALTGNLFRHVFISKQQLHQTVTLYDSDVDEYYYLTLQVVNGTSVLDDDRIVFVKER